MHIETILTPAELPALAPRDWRGTACVVFDILRATSTFVTALHHGAEQIIPVSDIAAAVTMKQQQPSVRLAGERDGVRIRAQQWDRLPACPVGAESAAETGQAGRPSHYSPVDFDFGNSPREFTPERVRGQTIVSTTTNGTRALRACAGAEAVLAGSFLNLAATTEFLRENNFATVLLVCAGTGEGVALEDVLAAGALVEYLVGNRPLTPALSPPRGERECCDTHGGKKDAVSRSSFFQLSDSSLIALKTFTEMKTDLATALGSSQNGRRLLAISELRDDVAFCAQRDVCNLVAVMDEAGALRVV